MTGFGRARREADGLAVEVELRSVNSRGLSLRCRLPGEWAQLEPRLEKALRAGLTRGSVDVSVRVSSERGSPRPRIDRDVLARYRRELSALGSDSTDGVGLLRLPGVVTLEEQRIRPSRVERLALDALAEALGKLLVARAREGARLLRVLKRERTGLEKQRAAIRKRAPTLVTRQHDGLRKRLERLLGAGPLPNDDPTLMREVAVLADRADVTEELDRLASHVVALDELLARDVAVGRELEFLLQEMGREVNTLGSKISDVDVTRRVIEMKSALERLREQAANIE